MTSRANAGKVLRAVCLLPALWLWPGCAVRADLGGSESPPTPDGAGTVDAVDAGSDAVDTGVGARDAADAPTETESSAPIGQEAGVDGFAADATSESVAVADVAIETMQDDAAPDQVVPTSCDDNIRDGDETDIDCGGSCVPCGLAQQCRTNADCGNWPGCDPILGCACDAVSFKCVRNHCVDHQVDFGETALDCGGGECPGCGPNQPCILDSDCSATLAGCDTNSGGCFCDLLSKTCVHSHCDDHKVDSSETALDCGGIHCTGCALGQNCFYDYDCASSACDLNSFTCITDHCADHRLDATESDIDCGGDCTACDIGQKCRTGLDCKSGKCNGGIQSVCI
jgi:hypothetical protein